VVNRCQQVAGAERPRDRHFALGGRPADCLAHLQPAPGHQGPAPAPTLQLLAVPGRPGRDRLAPQPTLQVKDFKGTLATMACEIAPRAAEGSRRALVGVSAYVISVLSALWAWAARIAGVVPFIARGSFLLPGKHLAQPTTSSAISPRSELLFPKRRSRLRAARGLVAGASGQMVLVDRCGFG
jgi:hypothetical protein